MIYNCFSMKKIELRRLEKKYTLALLERLLYNTHFKCPSLK